MVKLFNRGEPAMPETTATDSSEWILDNPFAEFVLMHTFEIKFMVMLGYTFLHGCKLFAAIPSEASLSYKFISMCLACTGGGIIVPIFINGIPVTLGQDAYPMAICVSFLIHQYLPILREVTNLSPIMKIAMIVLYETMRAFVVTKFTTSAAATIAPSEFSFPLFGPIFCGAIGGCGGAFLPFNKGLDPIKSSGLAQPMFSALIAASSLHIFLSTSLSNGVASAKYKGQVVMALFFIVYHIHYTYGKKKVKKD